MRIVIIGSGNLATHLSVALQSAGHDILQVFSRTLLHAEELATRLGCDAVASVDDICLNADAYIISIKDDAIADMARILRKGRAGAVLIHTAGSVPLSAMGNDGMCGVLYPMQTFSKHREVCFRDIPCFLEASDANAMAVVRRLADSISDHIHDLSSEKRKHLHLAAVFACNMVNHCYHLAERTLAEADIDFKVMLPLIAETARKVEDMSPHDAQTGPMVRYDVEVMNRQLQLIPDVITRDIYRLMAQSIHEKTT